MAGVEERISYLEVKDREKIKEERETTKEKREIRELRRLQKADIECKGYINKGKHGIVVQAKTADKDERAIKIVDGEYTFAMREADIMGLMSVDHINVVKFYGYWMENKYELDESWSNVVTEQFPERDIPEKLLVFELELCSCDMRQLLDERDKLFFNMVKLINDDIEFQVDKNYYNRDERKCVRNGLGLSNNRIINSIDILREIVNGLQYIHQLKIIHRDLKPANILCDMHDNFKISDFGVSQIFSQDMTPARGSPLYLAPEAWGCNYDYRSDIYSLGLVIYETMYPHKSRLEREDCIKDLKKDRHQLNGCQNIFVNEVHDFVLKMIDPSIDKRPSLSNAIDSLTAIKEKLVISTYHSGHLNELRQEQELIRTTDTLSPFKSSRNEVIVPTTPQQLAGGRLSLASERLGSSSSMASSLSYWLGGVKRETSHKVYGPLRSVLKEYKFLKLICLGSFGIIVEAHGPNDTNFALKFVEEEYRRWSLEKIYEMNHPNLVRINAIWVEESENLRTWSKFLFERKYGKQKIPRSFIVLEMELCSGNLRGYLNQRNEEIFNSNSAKERIIQKKFMEQCVKILIDVANGIEYMHSRRTIHRDIKPTNILYKHSVMSFDSGNVRYIPELFKITGFGVAKFDDESMTPNVGTFLYAAPEIMTQKYDFRADIYSLGLLIFEVIFPFDSKAKLSVGFRDLKNGRQIPSLLSESLVYTTICDMILEIVSEEPDMRPSILEIKETLNLWSQNNS